jgi:hypothetical protein
MIFYDISSPYPHKGINYNYLLRVNLFLACEAKLTGLKAEQLYAELNLNISSEKNLC